MLIMNETRRVRTQFGDVIEEIHEFFGFKRPLHDMRKEIIFEIWE